MITREQLDADIFCVHNAEDGFTFRPHHIEWKWFLCPQQIWRFTTNEEKPLLLELTSGVLIMPNYVFDTDLGSIPLPLRFLFPKDEFPVPYALHDDEYDRHGVYACESGSTEFSFVPTDRAGADRRLRRNIISICGGRSSRADSIYLGVRLGGLVPWATGKARKTKEAKPC